MWCNLDGQSSCLTAGVPTQLHFCRHRLVIFRDQGAVSGQRQVDISGWFGNLESTFYKHPKSPHPDIFRVSNSNLEGCTGVGRTGWHIDGSFMAKPFAYSTYHIGDTIFAPLAEVTESLSSERRERWERLHMLSDRRGGVAQPLIYPHPITGKPTMCLHTGMTDAYVWDLDTPQERVAGSAETRQILGEIEQVFRREIGHLVYSHKVRSSVIRCLNTHDHGISVVLANACGHKCQVDVAHIETRKQAVHSSKVRSMFLLVQWQPGDFIVSDNLAVAHEASPQTQMTVSDVGLRIMHRTTVAGQHHLHK
ncbi:MAG: hypothetical protein FRX49_00294 [Trebouxia sp. A1-2]|nr:MAG: hypothetical protein FRX49_00294 [Trebouxia sp. A1-2]